MTENVKMLDTGFELLPLVILNVGKSECDENFCIKRNPAPFNVVEFILDGEGTLEEGGKTYHPKAGDVYFLKHSTPHKYYADKKNPWKKIFVSFYGNVANSIVDNYLENTVVFSAKSLKGIFEKMYDTAFSSKDTADIQNECAVDLFKVFTLLGIKKSSKNIDLADKIKELIETNLSSTYNLDEITKSLNYSKNHIVNTFSAKYKITPYKYFLQAKTNLAKKYLNTTALSISQISNALGYSEPAYFSYSFKKETGITPTEYRKKSLL